ncbi:MAG TPA: VIT domain-containing protein [Tepidisphaeraceae bacterium]|nr:VIT domain-containing protein [Tepidisphaeraceae bacterium]
MRAILVGVLASFLVSPAAWGQSPQLLVSEGEKKHPVALAKADIAVQIAGQLAQTTMTLTFRNDADRVLEGELVFPLPENAAVCAYALDVHGSLVDAVTIEKEKARVVFETEVRKGIDPGIVEKVKGNNFRTRVYPIPAKGTRTIRVQYVSDLVATKAGSLSYVLPLNWEQTVAQASVRVEVLHSAVEPIAPEGMKGLAFRKEDAGFVAEQKFENVALKTTLDVALPDANRRVVAVEKKTRHAVAVESLDPKTADQFLKIDHYFAVTDDSKEAPKRAQAAKPARIAIAWDASMSRGDIDHKRELGLIEQHVKSIGDVIVDVVVFRDRPEAVKQFWVKGGDAKEILRHLSATIYDGGTSLAALSLEKETLLERRETLPGIAYWLLFTDGLANLGGDLPRVIDAPVYPITVDPRSNHAGVRHLAGKSGGAYVNLQRMGDEQALAAITAAPFALLSVEYDQAQVTDVYPSVATPVDRRITVTGRLLAPAAKITLNYGVGAQVTHRQVVELKQDGATETGLIPRYWAQARLAELGLAEDKHQREITRLGKEFNLVTAFTSMIVLERVEQYVEHQIVPPRSQPAMYAEFMKRIEQQREATAQETESKINRVLAMWKARQDWWGKEFKYPDGFKFVPPAAPKTAAGLAGGGGGGAGGGGGRVPAPTGAAAANPAAPAAPAAGRPMPARPSTDDLLGGLAANDAAPRPLEQAAARFESRADGTADGRGRGPASGRARIDVEMESALRSPSATLAIRGTRVSLKDGKDDAKTGAADATITIKEWSPDAPYLKALAAAKPEDRYAIYSDQAKSLKSTPAFFLDCAEFFARYDQRELAVRVLTNIPELGLDDGRLLRIAAHKLQQMGEINLAIDLFEQVTKLRPEEPQSWRDLALAHADRAGEAPVVGRAIWTMDGRAHPTADYARALELLHKVVMKQWQRFDEIEVIALMEANRIITKSATINGGQPVSHPFDKRLVQLLDIDLRIVLTWDTDNTDIDLHVVEPSGEECNYSHNRTTIGGLVSRDFTQGYGPEEYCLKKLMPGEYKIKVHFYGNRDQKLVGPTTVQATVITNFGRANEVRKPLTLRLRDSKDWVEVGTVNLK